MPYMNETISNTTITRCQHCGEWTNYADHPPYKALLADLKESDRVAGKWRQCAADNANIIRSLHRELEQLREVVERMERNANAHESDGQENTAIQLRHWANEFRAMLGDTED